MFKKKNRSFGFTLSEVLIALTIIGVVSALTIPTIQSNVRKKEVVVRLKQTHSILNNALTRAVTDNGPTNTWDEMGLHGSNQSFEFFDRYLAPYIVTAMKEKQITLKESGYNYIKKADGGVLFEPTKEKQLYLFNNGVAIIAMGGTVFTLDDGTKQFTSVTLLVDLNGSKGKNTLGKDIFYYKFYLISGTRQFELGGLEKAYLNKNTGYRYTVKIPREEQLTECRTTGYNCGALIQQNSWEIPDDYPISI